MTNPKFFDTVTARQKSWFDPLEYKEDWFGSQSIYVAPNYVHIGAKIRSQVYLGAKLETQIYLGTRPSFP